MIEFPMEDLVGQIPSGNVHSSVRDPLLLLMGKFDRIRFTLRL